MTAATLCDLCAAMDRQDALQIKTLEIVRTFHNPCAPITQFACKCRTCGTYWLALEVYDEDNVRASEWSWERTTEAVLEP
jgi:hypothetical protein